MSYYIAGFACLPFNKTVVKLNENAIPNAEKNFWKTIDKNKIPHGFDLFYYPETSDILYGFYPPMSREEAENIFKKCKKAYMKEEERGRPNFYWSIQPFGDDFDENVFKSEAAAHRYVKNFTKHMQRYQF